MPDGVRRRDTGLETFLFNYADHPVEVAGTVLPVVGVLRRVTRYEARYGSVDGYMSAIGVAPATRAALRDALTAPRPPAEGGPAAGGERGQ